MDDAERQARIDLAACYRAIAERGWDDAVFTHVSVRVPGQRGAFLINPFGLLFEEITASSLVKVDADGKILEDRTDVRINPAGYVIHSAVHAFRPDAMCVIHIHTIAGVAVSTQEGGLLPISQDALRFDGSIGYHDYEGFAFDMRERENLRRDLGDHPVMILRNHGTLAVGKSVAEAFLRIYFLERACAIQIAAQAGGARLVVPSAEVRKATRERADFIVEKAAPEAWAAVRRRLDRSDRSYRD